MIAFLARELLAATGGDPVRIRNVQQRVLVPLELSLINREDVTPARVAVLALQGLDNESQSHHRHR
jgi:hypothetical protein